MIFRASTIPQLRDDEIRFERPVPDTGESGSVELPASPELWDGVDEIRAEVYLPESIYGLVGFETIQLDITLATRSPGFDSNDGYWFSALVSERAGNIWSGWREFRFPQESFYTRGIPAGWNNISKASITCPTGSRVRNIRFVGRYMATGPRMTDEACLESIAGLPSGADIDDIVSIFRPEPGAEAPRRSLLKLRNKTPGSNQDADEILNGRIMGQDWKDGIDWDANPLGYIEWSIRIHMLAYLRPLISAFWKTDDSKYAMGIESILIDWIRKNPVPYGHRACGLAWGHSLVVTYRVYDVLIEAFAAMCACDRVAADSLIAVVKSIWEHSQFLLAFESFPPSNKTIAEARALTALGCGIPEYKDSQAWSETAFERLKTDMDIQVFPDGASYELSPGYQIAIASWFLEAFDTGRRYGFKEADVLYDGIRRMFRWSASLTRPDFTRPSISDAGSLDSKYGEDFGEPGAILSDDVLLWIATEGLEGVRPDYTSVAHRDSGYFVMRSGWEKDDLYLLFEGGPFGRFHQHEDMLGIDVYAYGTPFIVDPGITSYFPDPWTKWYRTTQAHNTVLVDGFGQTRRSFQAQEKWIESCRSHTHWESDDRIDCAVASYDGTYGNAEHAEAFIHTRIVAFVKPGYFVVFDELAGEGRHTYEALYHFMPFRLLIDRDTGAVRTGRMSESNIEILPLTPMETELICGANEPVQGWVSIGGQDVPAPVAIFRTTDSLPIRTGYIIAPFPDGRVTAGIDAGVDIGNQEWTVNIAHLNRADTIRVDWNNHRLGLRQG